MDAAGSSASTEGTPDLQVSSEPDDAADVRGVCVLQTARAFARISSASARVGAFSVVLIRDRIAEARQRAVAQLLGQVATHLRHCCRSCIEIGATRSRQASAASGADIVADPIRSQNITVT